ncbi:MAG TPA: hypothetical protein VMI13_05765 [Solirubrobacteraceae bacterium]|nr:hypothetical protein [Solirubrobacteraceae bacterium]
MSEILNMSWVFAVVFISIAALMLAFVLMAYARHTPTHRDK